MVSCEDFVQMLNFWIVPGRGSERESGSVNRPALAFPTHAAMKLRHSTPRTKTGPWGPGDGAPTFVRE